MKNFLYFLLTKSIGIYLNALSYLNPEKATKIAYQFFSEPREGRLVREKLPKVLKEAHKELYEHKGEHFQTYTWKGNENVVLLVHGWESNASRWENLLPYLKRSESTIIALDAPGHGLSSGKEFNIPQYATFIDIVAQKFKPKYLIGHSLGGKTCLYYQSVYQNENIEKMVILGAPSDFKIILNNYITLLSLNSKISSGIENHYHKHFNLTLEDFSGQKFASKIKTKGFIAHDTEDTIVLFEEGQKIASGWEDSIFMQTKGLGHSLHGEELYQKVYEFLFS